MNNQFLMNKPITVGYAFKKDGKGERHGTPAERLLAAQARKNNAFPTQQPPPPPPGMGTGMGMYPYQQPGMLPGQIPQQAMAPPPPPPPPGLAKAFAAPTTIQYGGMPPPPPPPPGFLTGANASSFGAGIPPPPPPPGFGAPPQGYGGYQ